MKIVNIGILGMGTVGSRACTGCSPPKANILPIRQTSKYR